MIFAQHKIASRHVNTPCEYIICHGKCIIFRIHSITSVDSKMDCAQERWIDGWHKYFDRHTKTARAYAFRKNEDWDIAWQEHKYLCRNWWWKTAHRHFPSVQCLKYLYTFYIRSIRTCNIRIQTAYFCWFNKIAAKYTRLFFFFFCARRQMMSTLQKLTLNDLEDECLKWNESNRKRKDANSSNNNRKEKKIWAYIFEWAHNKRVEAQMLEINKYVKCDGYKNNNCANKSILYESAYAILCHHFFMMIIFRFIWLLIYY